MDGHTVERWWLLEALQDKNLYNHPVKEFEIIETHISWLLLTGHYVYKIKKPVNFGFLNFSTLDKRHFYCEEELRLNRRLAPELYLEVVTINGAQEGLELNGRGPVLEYAVKMVQFPQTAQLDCLPADSGGLNQNLMNALAEKVAHFHLSAEPVSSDSDFGEVKIVEKAVMENFDQIRGHIGRVDPTILQQLDRLETWSRRQLQKLAESISQRKAQRFVRECHGDMHLRNIALWNGEIIIFDCIEFNKMLSYIDVISEIAFLIMDLEARGEAELAQRFLNSYLEITGDYEGLRLLRFYKVYRAVVRAKVDALRTEQEQTGSKEYAETFEDFLHYIKLAEQYTYPVAPFLLISHGLSGSGKSAVGAAIGDIFPAIRVRSDVERKRYFPEEEIVRGDLVERGRYSPEATRKTYSRLLDVVRSLLTADYSVIVDAANLKFKQRQQFMNLSQVLGVRCCILSYKASRQILRSRIEKRVQEGNDVSDATIDILEYQIASCESLSEDELLCTLEIDTEKPLNVGSIIQHIRCNSLTPPKGGVLQ